MWGTLLIVDDEKHTREGLEQAFIDNFDVFTAATPEEALRLLEVETFDVILTDLRMGSQNGMPVIDKALTLRNKPICIMMTAYGTIETAVEAMKRGAYDFLSKPINIAKLELIIKRALETRSLENENRTLHKKLSDRYHVEGILGNAQTFQSVLKQVETVAPSKASVLITGETGTGKELIANLIHRKSSRNAHPFVPVHCAALPPNLLESELFGHEKGAFTGAVSRRIGRFESANRGTLFLDEIGEIDLTVQVKLLRFLESKTIERIGSTQNLPIDVRLICATNKELQKEVQEGRFREDLLYRLNVVHLQIPALRERKEDIPLLLDHYLRLFSEENGVKLPTIRPQALKALIEYRWPGNVRELRNFAENVIVMYRGSSIDIPQLDGKFFEKKPLEHGAFSVEQNEKSLISDALKKSGGNKTKAADLLGMHRRTLHRKLKRWPELEIF